MKDSDQGMPVVLIDNTADPLATVVTVSFGDVLGQLLDTCEALRRLGLNINRADVTEGSPANRFFITDAATEREDSQERDDRDDPHDHHQQHLTYHPEAADFLVEGQHIDMPGDHEADEKILGARVEPKVKTLVSVEQAGPSRSKVTVTTTDRPGLLVDIVRRDEGSVLKRHLRRDRHRGPQGVRHHLLHVPGRAAVAQHDRARAERAHLLPLPARGGERRELLSSERRRRPRRTSPRRVRRRVWIERVDGTHERQYRDERSFDVSFVRRLTGERSRAGQERAKRKMCAEKSRFAFFAFFARRPHTGRVRRINPIFPVCAFVRLSRLRERGRAYPTTRLLPRERHTESPRDARGGA